MIDDDDATYPQSAAPFPHETAITFGLRVLRIVLQTGCPSEHATAALEAADHAYPVAISGQTDPRVCDRLSGCRHAILATLRARQLAPDTVEPEPAGAPARTGPLPSAPVPTHPAPASVPPAGAALIAF